MTRTNDAFFSNIHMHCLFRDSTLRRLEAVNRPGVLTLANPACVSNFG